MLIVRASERKCIIINIEFYNHHIDHYYNSLASLKLNWISLTHQKEMASTRKNIDDMRARCIEVREQTSSKMDNEADSICSFLYGTIAPLDSEQDVFILLPEKLCASKSMVTYLIGELKGSGFTVSVFGEEVPDDCRSAPSGAELWYNNGLTWIQVGTWGNALKSSRTILRIENTWHA